jgi:restriction endonuclease Mrr
MLPMLESLGDEKERRLLDLISHLKDAFGLSIDEVTEYLPSGKQSFRAVPAQTAVVTAHVN